MIVFRIFYLLYIFYQEIFLFLTLSTEEAIKKIVSQNSNDLEILMQKILCSPLLVKLVQWISQYKTELPDNFKTTLAKLQTECTKHKRENLDKIIEKYKLDIKDVSILPNSSGSVGSVYCCFYQGKKAVIKILHDDVVSNLQDDLILLKVVQIFYKSLNFDEIYSIMSRQTNLKHEASNLIKIKENLKSLDFIIIPDVLSVEEDYMICTYEENVPITELGSYLNESKMYLGIMYLKMLVVDRFIHGDLHNGNVLYRIENNQLKIVLLDFGICNSIEQVHLDIFINIVEELCNKNYQQMMNLFYSISLIKATDKQKTELRLLINGFIYEGKIKNSRNLPNLAINLMFQIIDKNILSFPGTFLYLLSNYLLIDHAYNANDILFVAKQKICKDKNLINLFGYDIYKIKNNLEILMEMREEAS